MICGTDDEPQNRVAIEKFEITTLIIFRLFWKFNPGPGSKLADFSHDVKNRVDD